MNFISIWQVCGMTPSMSDFFSTEADLLRLVETYHFRRAGPRLYAVGLAGGQDSLPKAKDPPTLGSSDCQMLKPNWCRSQITLPKTRDPPTFVRPPS